MKTRERTVALIVSMLMAATCFFVPAGDRIYATEGEGQDQTQTQAPEAQPTQATQPTQPADPFAGKKGWVKDAKGKKYYIKDGKPLKGVKKVKKTWYEFDKKTGVQKRKIGDDMDKKAQKYTSRKKYLILVSYDKHRVRVYKGKKNKWTRKKDFKCTLGKKSTPTPKGTYTITSRGKYFNTGSNCRCWYWTGFIGNIYLFHSVIYNRNSRPNHIIDGRLGKNLSHGCIRLSISNAKWIYRNVPRRTKVVIY